MDEMKATGKLIREIRGSMAYSILGKEKDGKEQSACIRTRKDREPPLLSRDFSQATKQWGHPPFVACSVPGSGLVAVRSVTT